MRTNKQLAQRPESNSSFAETKMAAASPGPVNPFITPVSLQLGARTLLPLQKGLTHTGLGERLFLRANRESGGLALSSGSPMAPEGGGQVAPDATKNSSSLMPAALTARRQDFWWGRGGGATAAVGGQAFTPLIPRSCLLGLGLKLCTWGRNGAGGKAAKVRECRLGLRGEAADSERTHRTWR